MKATGIIRKMDSLGRLVVPKEFRRTLGADDGTEFEIYTDGVDTICFKKVVPVEDEINWKKMGDIVRCLLGEDAEFALYDKNGMLQEFNGDYPLQCAPSAIGRPYLDTARTDLDVLKVADILKILIGE